jgi:hypothetical protein
MPQISGIFLFSTRCDQRCFVIFGSVMNKITTNADNSTSCEERCVFGQGIFNAIWTEWDCGGCPSV